jgi:hypothetical protein
VIGEAHFYEDDWAALDKQLLDVAPHRLSWMSLLARVFRIDVSVCQRCKAPSAGPACRDLPR